MTNKKKEITVTEKNKGGRPTKYTLELAKALASDLASMTIKQACKNNDISEETYYQWLHIHKEFSELSTSGRKTRAIYHFNKAAEVIEELDNDPNNEDIRVDVARLRYDAHLRLAGKANQGLFGDKGVTVKNNTQINVAEASEQLDTKLLNLINFKKLEER